MTTKITDNVSKGAPGHDRTGSLIGYARTSTLDQKASLDAQAQELTAHGCHPIFAEEVSSVDTAARTELDRAMAWCRPGDTLVVTRLDRLARNVGHLFSLVDTLRDKGAALRVLDMNLDTGTPTGHLILTVLGGVAQFEREIMLERQREGIEKARQAGKYKGRKPTARAKANDVLALRQAGLGASAIAKRVGIGRASVYRILAEGQGSDADNARA